MTEYRLSGAFQLCCDTVAPPAITAGPDGNLWFTEGYRIGRITPTGRATEFQYPICLKFINIVAADGSLVVTEAGGTGVRISTTGALVAYNVPVPVDPSTIVGPDGAVWSTYDNGGISRTASGGRTTRYGGLPPAARPSKVTVGPDANVWFTAETSSSLWRITPAGRITSYGGLPANARPHGLIAGPDGNLWFVYGPHRLGRITPGGVITGYRVPGADLLSLGAGPDGNLWFTAGTDSNDRPGMAKIGRGQARPDCRPHAEDGTADELARRDSNRLTRTAKPVRSRIVRRCRHARSLGGFTSRGRAAHHAGGPWDDCRMPVVVGIETSCDETGVGVVRDGELIGSALASSMDEHARFGGVVPEVAARAHLEALVPCLDAALAQAGITGADVDAVAVTAGPGLATALQVGLAAAKAYAIAWDVPLYGVHHLAGHVAADTLAHGPLPNPCIVLIVSGGHTSLLVVRDLVADEIQHLGDTLDDAAGEAFDKVGRVLGLPFPGGPWIDRAAKEGDPAAIAFPRGLTRPGDPPFEFSFSGLKTAVARWVERAEREGREVPTNDVAASFQQAVVDVLMSKSIAACRDQGLCRPGDRRRRSGELAASARSPPNAAPRPGSTCGAFALRYCTDNGAMIGAGHMRCWPPVRPPDDLDLGADPSAALRRAAIR